jgi:hypothetical protein
MARSNLEEALDMTHHCDWKAASFMTLKQLIAEKIPEGSYRRFAMGRIEQRVDPDPTKTWKARTRWQGFGPLAEARGSQQRPTSLDPRAQARTP